MSDYSAEALRVTIERSKGEIREDVRSGLVPADVKSFSQLHDYVDANGYGGAFEQPFDGSDEACMFWNDVQGHVNVWIKTGMK